MGVIFRKDDNGNYYYFALGTLSDGSCSLLKFYEGEWESLFPWGYCPSLIPKKPNKITIIATGNHIITLINDRVVGDFNNDAIQGNKIEFAIRVYYPDTGIYEFDNLELKTPSP